jgi:NAD(P)H-quinone oxidoreductase subunit 5
VTRTSLPATVRYGAVPLVFLPAITVYALVYETVLALLAGLPVVTAPAELSLVHGLVAAVFLAVYLATEFGLHRRSTRLYVTLVNAGRPSPRTLLTSPEEYND